MKAAKSWLPIALAMLSFGAFSACDEDTVPAPTPARNGGAGGGGGGAGGAGSDARVDAPAGDAASADAADAGAPDAGMLAVNRPERRDFSPALLAQLHLKSGFQIKAYATNVMGARMLARGPDGSIYVTAPTTSQVSRLRDSNGDGDVDDAGERAVVASATTTPALQGVHGIAFNEDRVYLASVKSVVSGTVGSDGAFTGLTTLVSDLPDGGQHANRTIAVGPDGKLYVSVGSDCNACAESNSEHATMLRLNLDGSAASNPPNPQHPMLAHNPMAMISPRVWASGLRNTLGFDWHPTTSELWGFDQGSDGLGDQLPLEELNRLTAGRSYGWPYCFNQRQVDPVVDEPSQMTTKAQYCPGTEPNVAGVEAHSSPIAFLFYRGGQFPAEYRNDAFQVLRGSWDRTAPVGYKVVRVHFEGGSPAAVPGTTSPVEDFLSGFLIEGGRAHFGRLAGLTVDATGALVLSDDTNGVIYRISYGTGGTDGGTDAADAADGGADAP
jgi:glucose/arabinose dehydrogenase